MQGVIAAAITPRGSHGDLSLGAAFDLIDYLSAAGVNGIALFTSHRDLCAIPPDERARLVSLGRKRSRVPILVGVGSVSFDISVSLAREARAADAAAILLPPLREFPCSEEDRREFHVQFLEEVGSGIPIFLEDILVHNALEFLRKRQIAGVVARELDLDPWLPAACEHGFTVLGHSMTLTPVRVFEAHGVISPLACAIPEVVAGLRRAVSAGNQAEIDRLHHLVREFLSWLSWFPWPTFLQVATAARGIKTGPLPSPLSPTRQKKLDEFREWFRTWLPAAKKQCANA